MVSVHLLYITVCVAQWLSSEPWASC